MARAESKASVSNRDTARAGLDRGLRLFVALVKVMAPAYLAVAILKRTVVLEALCAFVAPAMQFCGLPPETAVPMVVGWFINLYAAIGAMQALSLNASQITQLAVVCLIAHNLVVEVAVVARLKTRWFLILVFRVLFGLAMGAAMHYLFGFGGDLSPDAASILPPRPGMLEEWGKDAMGLANTLGKTFAIVVPLMVLMEFLRNGPWLDRLTNATYRPLRILGLEKHSVMPLWAGFFLGIAYGAGMILDAAENEGFTGRQAFLVSVFLGVCHAIVEDTLLFAAIGANVFWITVPRIALACILTWMSAHLLARVRPVENGVRIEQA